MDNERDIIQFEDLFKEEIERNKKKQEEPENKQSFWFAILSYLLIMLVGATLISILVFQFNIFRRTYTEEERIFYALKKDTGGIALVSHDTFNLFYDDYKAFVTSIGMYNDHYVLIHVSNLHADDVLLKEIIVGDIEYAVFDEDAFTEIFILGLHKKWGSSNLEVSIYVAVSQSIGSLSDEAIFIDGSRTIISSFGSAIINFTVYLLLVPVLIFFLKRPLLHDFYLFKSNLSSFIVPIVVGYIYIFAGNIISNLLTTFLSRLLSIEPQTANNQLIIIDALKSNGVIFMVIGAVILGPIVEELIFRKAIFGVIANEKTALVVSSFIFGIIHLSEESSIPNALVNGVAYFVMGFIFGIIYMQTKKNIMIVTIVHMISNLISVLAIILFL